VSLCGYKRWENTKLTGWGQPLSWGSSKSKALSSGCSSLALQLGSHLPAQCLARVGCRHLWDF
jgi:hypothetical protein